MDNLKDLVTAVVDKKPVQFEQSFKAVMAEKVLNRLSDMKQSMAETFFGGKSE